MTPKLTNEKTLVFRASLKSNRYCNLAVNRRVGHNMKIEAFGLKEGKIGNVQSKTNLDDFQNIHTITLYIGPSSQPDYYRGLLKLGVKRIIFDPGA